MNLREFSIISDSFYAGQLSSGDLDRLLAEGWRHFGQYFFRYNLALQDDRFHFVTPLRIRVAEFIPSKSQRRVVRKNRGLVRVINPIEITPEKTRLFARHKKRFSRGIPESIYSFLDRDPAKVPCEAFEICVYDDSKKLLATSFFDIGKDSVSGIYAMFDPDESQRSLGIYTLLLELEIASVYGKKFYYQGYAYAGSSFYDYKKQFSGLERFDWAGRWHKRERS